MPSELGAVTLVVWLDSSGVAHTRLAVAIRSAFAGKFTDNTPTNKINFRRTWAVRSLAVVSETLCTGAGLKSLR